MRIYKIDMGDYEFPVLLNKSILYHIIQQVRMFHKTFFQIEIGVLIEGQYIKYLMNIFHSNEEYLAAFQIAAGTSFDIEILYMIFMEQFNRLFIDECKCFVKVKMIKLSSFNLRYFFKCSQEFYNACHNEIGTFDLTWFA